MTPADPTWFARYATALSLFKATPLNLRDARHAVDMHVADGGKLDDVPAAIAIARALGWNDFRYALREVDRLRRVADLRALALRVRERCSVRA